jgi:hypothetical protein
LLGKSIQVELTGVNQLTATVGVYEPISLRHSRESRVNSVVRRSPQSRTRRKTPTSLARYGGLVVSIGRPLIRQRALPFQ